MKVIRLYNCTLQETQGEITLYRKPVRACLLDLKEEVQQELKLDDRSIPLALKPAQVLSIGVYFG
jgi:alpha-mannosidase